MKVRSSFHENGVVCSTKKADLKSVFLGNQLRLDLFLSVPFLPCEIFREGFFMNVKAVLSSFEIESAKRRDLLWGRKI